MLIALVVVLIFLVGANLVAALFQLRKARIHHEHLSALCVCACKLWLEGTVPEGVDKAMLSAAIMAARAELERYGYPS